MVKQALLPGVTEAPLSSSESKTRNAKCSSVSGGNEEKEEKSLYLKINVAVTVSTIPTVTVLQIF